MDQSHIEDQKERAHQIYTAHRTVYSPYFKDNVTLNADGFHHLRYSARRERNKEEQILKFNMLPLGLHVLKVATTVQEYRKLLSPVGEHARRDGAQTMKLVQWWGFIAILEEHDIKVRIVVRKVGEGQVHFWSVMPYSHLRRGMPQKLFTAGLEDD